MSTGRSFRIAGGSQSDKAIAKGQGMIGFFQKGVNVVKPSGKHPLSGRILPARDPGMNPEDSAWANSVVPYRDMASGELDEDTQSPAFANWYTNVFGYRFFGRGSEDFLSPQTLKAIAGDGVSAEDAADPIQDIFNFAQDCDNPDWVELTKKPEKKNSRSVVPLASKLSLLNMYVKTGKGAWENAAVIVSRSALENLKLKLCWPTPRSIEPVDPKFPDYLYGDVTAVKTGLLTTIQPIRLENIDINGFVFSTKDFTLEGAQRMPIKDDKKVLAARYDLLSSEVLKILTYQQIVDFLVQDGTIPYELIQAACGQNANIGSSPRQNTTTSAGTRTAGRTSKPEPEPEEEPEAEPITTRPAASGGKAEKLKPNPLDAAENDDAIPGIGEAPEAPEEEAPEAPEAPEEDAPPAPEEDAPEPEPEPELWASIDRAVSKKPVSEIEAAIQAGCSVKVMQLDKQGGWQLPAALGLGIAEAQAEVAKPAPKPEAPKAAAKAPAKAPKKDEPKKEAPKAGGDDPTAGLNEEEKARYAELDARMSDDENPASTEEINELVELVKKGSAKS